MRKIILLMSMVWGCFLNAAAQTQQQWAQSVHWDGVSHWSRYINMLPAKMGPNALPVPMTGNGSLDTNYWVAATGQFHSRTGESSQSIVLYANLPLVKGVITLDAAFVFTLVDIFFGGDGKGRRTEGEPEFTPMEVRLVRKFVAAILQDMREAWKPFAIVDFQLGASEINPIFAAVAAGSDPVCVTGFDLLLGGREFHFDIVLPDAVVEPVRHLRDAGQQDQIEADSRRWSATSPPPSTRTSRRRPSVRRGQRLIGSATE